jgi:hypothetical protein
MRTSKQKKKIQLNAEVLRKLNPEQAGRVAGGRMDSRLCSSEDPAVCRGTTLYRGVPKPSDNPAAC